MYEAIETYTGPKIQRVVFPEHEIARAGVVFVGAPNRDAKTEEFSGLHGLAWIAWPLPRSAQRSTKTLMEWR